jgi:3'(2'), 5'-bisphosphate nucleotidase
MDSQAKHVALASGAADLLLRVPPQRDFHDAIWDSAAGSLLIAEAGGRVTDLDGRALDSTVGRRPLRNDGFLGLTGCCTTPRSWRSDEPPDGLAEVA